MKKGVLEDLLLKTKIDDIGIDLHHTLVVGRINDIIEQPTPIGPLNSLLSNEGDKFITVDKNKNVTFINGTTAVKLNPDVFATICEGCFKRREEVNEDGFSMYMDKAIEVLRSVFYMEKLSMLKNYLYKDDANEFISDYASRKGDMFFRLFAPGIGFRFNFIYKRYLIRNAMLRFKLNSVFPCIKISIDDATEIDEPDKYPSFMSSTSLSNIMDGTYCSNIKTQISWELKDRFYTSLSDFMHETEFELVRTHAPIELGSKQFSVCRKIMNVYL